MVDNQSYRDIKSKLSPITVSKVMSALEASAEKEITAQELAFRLGVTKRSANRFLSTLEREEILKVAYKRELLPEEDRRVYLCEKKSSR
ncbi:MAG: hypothetical protein ACLT8Y_10815 [Dorea formicigenerans]